MGKVKESMLPEGNTVGPLFTPRQLTLDIADYQSEVNASFSKGVVTGLKLIQDVFVDGKAISDATNDETLIKMVTALQASITKSILSAKS